MDPITLKLTQEGAAAAATFLNFVGPHIDRAQSAGAIIWRGPRLRGDTYKPNQRIQWPQARSALTDQLLGHEVREVLLKARDLSVEFYRAPVQDKNCGARIWAGFKGDTPWNSTTSVGCEIICDTKACRPKDPAKCV
jgi:hypothetical protein